MKQEVVDKYNAVTDAANEDYAKSRDGGFFWLWFMERARGKVADSGFLPQNGFLIFEPRYIESADAVLDGLLASVKSVEGPNIRATKVQLWERTDLEQWRQLALSFSVMMFDAGCVAAHILGYEKGFDPLWENAPAAIFGDVGFIGLRDKSLSFLRTVGGEDAVDLACEIGDCTCAHLYADRNLVERVFKETPELRESFLRGVCKAAYVAGATFAKMVAGRG